MEVKELLEIAKKYYSLKELDTGGFTGFKVNGMKFDVHTYEAEGLGRISTMYAAGMFGAVKMTTFIVNPFDVDAPLLSIDRMNMMGNDLLYLEPFDTTLEHGFNEEDLTKVMEKNRAIPANEVKENWYDHMRMKATDFKKGKKKDAADMDAYIKEYLDVFMKELTHTKKVSDPEEKKRRAAVYSDGLVANGGPSTDVFKKSFGDEKTKEFFDKVLFGVRG